MPKLRARFVAIIGAVAMGAVLLAGCVTPLTLQNGWTNESFGAAKAGFSKADGILHFRGAIATSGANTQPFTLPAGSRPATTVYVPIDLCDANNGRLVIQPSGVVNVQAENGDFSQAQCFTSLDGAWFALNATGFTNLGLLNGWNHAPFSTSNAAVRTLGNIVHFKGAVANGTAGQITTLPVGFRPATDVYVPVDLCNATSGRLYIQPSGAVSVQAAGPFSNAQCFTSLEGASFARNTAGFTNLTLQSGWTHAPFATSNAAVSYDGDIVRFKGAVAGGTTGTIATLPTAFRPTKPVWVPVDLCNAANGRLYIQPSGVMLVSAQSAFSDAQCFTSLDGASFVLDTSNDTDNDRLPNSVETNTGVFVNASNTGTNPNNADTDGDGINDGDEVKGTPAGLNLPGMGTSPLKKNLLLEFDWFNDSNDCAAHSHRPTGAQIAAYQNTFANANVANPDGTTGVKAISDYGQGGVFTGGNLIADADGVIASGVEGVDYKNYKASNFASNRAGYFHYVLAPHRYDTSSGSSGQAEIIGDDLIVSLQCFVGGVSTTANTIMHELGHNLALRHGGNVNTNYKPNYNSVMNYRYQFPGVDTNCNVTGDGVLDYSYGTRLTLNENALNEFVGICGAPALDWNSSGTITNPVVADINSFDGLFSVLTDHNDWTNLFFGGLADGDGQAVEPELVREQPVPASQG